MRGTKIDSPPWVMAMNWLDLLFIHWPVRPEALRPLIPPTLELDTFEGEAWIGVVPFRMTGVRPRLVPALPWFSAFPELNVRTYVKTGPYAGVWFLSLDAGNPLAVRAARLTFHLPYFTARMNVAAEGDAFRYASVRTHRGAPPANFDATYRPTGPVYTSTAGDLDHWLTERYALFAVNRRGDVRRSDVVHDRWPLQPAEIELRENTMLAPFGITPPDTRPVLHFAKRIDAVASALAGV